MATALRQLGTPYVWGGGSASGATRGGFDCSGLALYAWARAGVSLPHYTGSQFARGTKIPISRLRPGDLVFFGGGTGDPTHVGIYLKNGVMIHAPKTGDVVRKVDFLHSPYYRARYRGAIRPTTPPSIQAATPPSVRAAIRPSVRAANAPSVRPTTRPSLRAATPPSVRAAIRPST
ncbi:NlpC/P60 family protein [Sphaerisporangium sp. NPDC051017]|uniref:C40 family peptidase n=1 Tax=Sphaerisporangium sp. NPDC051017 TaxID=3154636 RepID=UPI00343C8FE3